MTARKEHDVEFLEYVVKSIVDHPDEVKVERTIDEMGVLITLAVHPEDMGQIIGRSGATAKSVRTLLRVIGARNNARVNLKILEPEGSQRGPRPPRSGGETPSEGTSSGAEGGEKPAPRARKPKPSTEAKEASVDEAIDNLEI